MTSLPVEAQATITAVAEQLAKAYEDAREILGALGPDPRHELLLDALFDSIADLTDFAPDVAGVETRSVLGEAEGL